MVALGVLFVALFFIRNKNIVFNGYHNKIKPGERDFLTINKRKGGRQQPGRLLIDLLGF